MKQYFELLGVNEGTSPEELKRIWRKKCLDSHPDKGGDPEIFRKIMHAYKMLTDASYQNEFKKNDISEVLLFKVRIAVSFEKAFFGHFVMLNFNRVELAPKTLDVLEPGEKIEPLSIRVDIPPGSVHGFEKSFPEFGFKCADRIGDCHVQVAVKPHPRFKCEALDILSDEGVPLEVMLKGGKVEVPTMWGLKTLRVPPGTQPGDKLLIKKFGVVKEGDHWVRVTPIFPSGEDLREKRSLKDLNIDWDPPQKSEEEYTDESLNDLFSKMSNQFSK